jgi:hypothetical protein
MSEASPSDCLNCGKPLTPDAKFCRNCGTQVDVVTESADTPQMPPPQAPSGQPPPPPPAAAPVESRSRRRGWLLALTLLGSLAFGCAVGALAYALTQDEGAEFVAPAPPPPDDPLGDVVTVNNETEAPEDPDAVEEEEPEYSGPGGKAVRALEAHWRHRVNGEFEEAYYDLSEGYRPQIGTVEGWVAEFEADQLYKAHTEFAPADIEPGFVVVDVVLLQTEAVKTGCNNWTGSYFMIFEAGEWRIDKADIEDHNC